MRGERILVGLDDSEESWNAFDYAVREAKEKGIDEITVVHSEVGGKGTDIEEYRSGEKILEEAEDRGEEEDIEVKTHFLVRGHDPDVDIVKFAEENDYNHILVGSRGRSGIGRALLGSVAEGIVEKAHCVVTVVRAAPFLKKAGKWVEVREIENLLSGHEGVKRVAVLGVPDEELGNRIIAFIKPAKDYELTKGEIKDFMNQLVADDKIEEQAIPDEIKFLDELPQTGVGKIDKNNLRSRYT